MKTIEMSKNDRQLRRMVEEAAGETLVLTDGGRPVAAVVPIGNLGDAESRSLGTDPKFLRILRKSFKELDAGRGISLAEMRRRVGLK